MSKKVPMTNIQIPEKLELPNLKRRAGDVLKLALEISLELGRWNSVLPVDLVVFINL